MAKVPLENLVKAVQTSKEHAYNLANICKTCEHRSKVFHWTKAQDSDVTAIRKEIVRIHKLASKKSGETSLYRDAVIRTFNEHFYFTDCGHIHTGKMERPYLIGYPEQRYVSFEDRLKRVGLGLGESLSKREADKKLKEDCEKLLAKIDELYQNELVTVIVKKDIDDNLCKNVIHFSCGSCEGSFADKYEIPDLAPCEGIKCPFKSFVTKLAEQLKYDSKFINVYGFGVLQSKEWNIIVSRGEICEQPSENLARFSPDLILITPNFFSNKHLPIQERWVRPGMIGPARPIDVNVIGFESAMNFLIPTLVYDCESETYIHTPIEKTPPSIEKIAQKLASMEFAIKPSEKAYRAAHDRIVEITRDMGLGFGFKPKVEFPLAAGNIDIGWLDRTTGALEVAIEVELSASILGDLWKLCEARPKLAVLIVKGGYYQTALKHVIKSELIKKMKQRLMVLDASSKEFTIVEGEKLLVTSGKEKG